MDFWGIYKNSEMSPGFGQARLTLCARDRIHISNSAIADYCTPIGPDTGFSRKYDERSRYVLAGDLTYDLLVSIYDVNSSRAFLLRLSNPLSEIAFKRVAATIKSLARPNLEMRVIGLQNGATGPLGTVRELIKHAKFSLQEVDIFGVEMRNVAFDLKQGMAFDVLLLDRPYARGELVNKAKREEFDAKKSEFKLQ